MDKCNYYLKVDGHTVVFHSDKELSAFVKNNLVSTEKGLHIKRSQTSKSIIQTPQDLTLEALGKIDPYSDVNTNPYEFLKKEHVINSKIQLLVPELREDSYKERELEELKKIYPTKTDTELEELVDNELYLDHKMKDISSLGINIIQTALANAPIKGKTLGELILKLVEEVHNYNQDVLVMEDNSYKKVEFSIDNYTDVIKKLTSTMINYSKVLNSSDNYIKVNQYVNSSNNLINANIHFLEVYPDGTPNIYEIKVSRNKFDGIPGWNSAKKLETDYILGIKRQLLDNYINTSETSLNILQFIIPKEFSKSQVLSLDNITLEKISDRNSGNSGLEYQSGLITRNLRTLLPSAMLRDHLATSDLDDIIKGTLKEMFPTHNFQTKRMIEDIDGIIKTANKNSEGDDKISIYDKLNNVAITEDKTKDGWEQRFHAAVSEYFDRWNSAKDSKVGDLVRAIKSAKSDKQGLNFSGRKAPINMQNMFKKYLFDDWDILNNDRFPELSRAGILLFRNRQSGIIDAVSLTINTLGHVNKLAFGDTLLGQFKPNKSVQNDDKILPASNANIEIMKVLTVLNNLKTELADSAINSIKVYNLWQDKAAFETIDKSIYNFNLLSDQIKKKNPSAAFENNFKNRKIKTAEIWATIYDEMMSVVKDVTDSDLKNVMITYSQSDDENMKTANDKLKWFMQLRDSLLDKFGNILADVDQTKVQDFSNPIQLVYYLASLGVSYYANLNDTFDYEVPRYGIRGGDMVDWVRTMVLGSAPEYDSKGNKIVGIFQGQYFNTTDSLQSNAFTKLHGLITIAQNKIASEFNQEQRLITNATNKYYDAINRSSLQKTLIGDADKYHEVLFETSKLTGKITNEFKFKNPWDPKSDLNAAQREYLETQIFTLFRYSKKNLKYNIKTIEEFKKHAEFKSWVEDGSIFKAPLVKKMSLSKWKTITTDGFRKTVGRVFEDVKGLLDQRDLTEEDRAHSYKIINGYRQMYNQFDQSSTNDDYRTELINKHGVGFFEVNLDVITLKHTFEAIREKHFNNILPNIHSAITVMKFHGWSTGNTDELKKALDDFYDQLKISIYGVSIINPNDEIADTIAVVKKMQKIASVMAIGLRPALLIKELVVGTIKNVSFSWSKIYGDDSFSSKDLTKAYGIVLTPTEKSFAFIEALNLEMRFANQDLNHIVDRKKVDRHGLNFLSDKLYWCNTAPDYVNRLTLLVAKMIHDGSYDAHSLNEDGQLTYDPTKDKRYSEYFRLREKYNYEYVKGQDEYNNQRSLYLSVIKEFNGQRSTVDEPILTEKDKIPQAYTAKERASIKNFSDMAYGAYDHELSPLMKHTALGTIFGQFLTFWPSKVKYYLGKPGAKSPRGYMGHKYDLDENGNKIYYYQKIASDDNGEPLLDENGNPEYEDVTKDQLGPNDPIVPSQVWVGSVSEGLLYSLGLTIRDLATGNFDKTNPQRLRQAKLALHDLLIALLLMWIGYVMMNKNEGGKIPFKELAQYEKLATKIAMKSFGEFDPFSSVFGAVSWTPAFTSILGNTVSDFKEVISGDSDLENFLRNNIRLMEVFPDMSPRK